MTRAPTREARLESAFADFHERNLMCPEPDCDWGVIETGEEDPVTFLPITHSCPVCAGRGFLPKKAA
uniref:Small CPxCG-related zinc finger protein n=1 Tax=Caulobacter phage BL57 TaxID=3348355 RepID=A0AB74UI48_9VIRU